MPRVVTKAKAAHLSKEEQEKRKAAQEEKARLQKEKDDAYRKKHFEEIAKMTKPDKPSEFLSEEEFRKQEAERAAREEKRQQEGQEEAEGQQEMSQEIVEGEKEKESVLEGEEFPIYEFEELRTLDLPPELKQPEEETQLQESHITATTTTSTTVTPTPIPTATPTPTPTPPERDPDLLAEKYKKCLKEWVKPSKILVNLNNWVQGICFYFFHLIFFHHISP